ncbi:hypothetical protein MJO29_007317 [Puccinia striiformis f. sp. tritici]|nr:hypothetical protein MJO29_007317 [Puccinia striiformis f. sp. tritici]
MRGDPQVSPRTHTRPSSPSYHDSSTEFPMAPEENGQTDSNSTPREDPSTCASSKNGAHDRSAVEKVVNQDNHDVEKLTQGDTHSEGISEVDSEVEKVTEIIHKEDLNAQRMPQLIEFYYPSQ